MNAAARPRFTTLGHATIRCDLSDGKVILIDPFVDNNPSCPEELKSFERIDAILITHGHFDHISNAVELAQRYRPEAVVANPEVCHWLAGKGVENLREMNTGGTIELLGCAVTMTWATHSSGIVDGDAMLYGGNPGGFIVRSPEGYTFFHLGDTDLFSDLALLAELYRPELAFVPIGDNYTMGPRTAAHACRMMGIPRVIPIHWGTFPVLTGTPEEFVAAVRDLGLDTEVVVLQPGEEH